MLNPSFDVNAWFWKQWPGPGLDLRCHPQPIRTGLTIGSFRRTVVFTVPINACYVTSVTHWVLIILRVKHRRVANIVQHSAGR